MAVIRLRSTVVAVKLLLALRHRTGLHPSCEGKQATADDDASTFIIIITVIFAAMPLIKETASGGENIK